MSRVFRSQEWRHPPELVVGVMIALNEAIVRAVSIGVGVICPKNAWTSRS